MTFNELTDIKSNYTLNDLFCKYFHVTDNVMKHITRSKVIKDWANQLDLYEDQLISLLYWNLDNVVKLKVLNKRAYGNYVECKLTLDNKSFIIEWSIESV